MTKTVKISRRFSLIYLLFTLPHFLKAQDPAKHITIKLYTNFSHLHSSSSQLLDYRHSIIQKESTALTQLGRITPAITFTRKRGRFHEFELNHFQLSRNETEKSQVNLSSGTPAQTVQGTVHKHFLMGLRYEYGIPLIRKHETSSLIPYLSTSLNPILNIEKNEPKVNNAFAQSNMQVGTLLSIIPRLTYTAKKKWFFDLNIPLQVGNVVWQRNKVQNPILSPKQQVNPDLTVNLLPSIYQVRLGIGLKI